MLEIKHLVMCYPGAPSKVLDNVNLVAKAGVTGIIGPSGSGKTTLFRVIAGQLAPESGEILLNKAPLTAQTRIGLVFQDFRLIDFLNVEDNVNVARNLNGLPSDPRRCQGILKSVGLGGLESRALNSLSGGQLQRVAIARALAIEPDILLADEPTGALDRKNSDVVAALLHELGERESIPILLATHDLRLARTAQRVYSLDGEGGMDPHVIEPHAGDPA
ncbi:ABC transporter ATP-binding protein [Luteococcus sp.]|uniref:ABC transporter ATP-binding protein n=1 Tax=Luteococcus sp. TaxID=1969402 RepID=UPI0037363589